MATWSSGHTCTDCGREIDRPGTCDDCKVSNQPAARKPEKVKRNG